MKKEKNKYGKGKEGKKKVMQQQQIDRGHTYLLATCL